jgi:hypothetical protein
MLVHVMVTQHTQNNNSWQDLMILLHINQCEIYLQTLLMQLALLAVQLMMKDSSDLLLESMHHQYELPHIYGWTKLGPSEVLK